MKFGFGVIQRAKTELEATLKVDPFALQLLDVVVTSTIEHTLVAKPDIDALMRDAHHEIVPMPKYHGYWRAIYFPFPSDVPLPIPGCLWVLHGIALSWRRGQSDVRALVDERAEAYLQQHASSGYQIVRKEYLAKNQTYSYIAAIVKDAYADQLLLNPGRMG